MRFGLSFPVPALLVGKQGHMLNGLQSMFKAYQKFYPLYVSEDADEAVSLVKRKHIKVVLLDSYLFEGVTMEIVKELKRQYPGVKCVVLTDKAQVPQAVQFFGADMVLPGSIPSAQLFSDMDQLLRFSV